MEQRMCSSIDVQNKPSRSTGRHTRDSVKQTQYRSKAFSSDLTLHLIPLNPSSHYSQILFNHENGI